MARKNNKGTSWHRLELEDDEEEAIKKWLDKKDISGFQLLRYLVRQHLKKEGLINEVKSYLS